MVRPSNSEDLISILNLGNPLHMQKSDFTSITIISVKLTVSKDLFLGQNFSDNSAKVWAELKETYDKLDGSIIFNLLQKIHGFKQGELTISEYYHKLNSLWREFDIMTKLPKSSLLYRETLPDIEDAFAIVPERNIIESRMSNTSDKGTTFGDGAARVGMQLRSSPKVSTSSPLVSPSTIINVPRELYSIDVAATFGVPLTTVGDLQKLINDIDAGKHDELLSELTNEDRMETLEALGSICNSIKVDRNNADVIPCKVSYADDSINLNVDESTIPSDPIVQSVDINKSTSYAGVAGGIIENVSTRFEHTLYGYFIGKRMAFLVVEYYASYNWAKHGLKRVMMNSKGFFFFKFDSRAGLESVLEGGPWLIHKSLIILKKWSMDTKLLKEELTRIPIWVKLHDVPIQVFEEDGISLIATFIGKPVMLDSYTSSMCNDSIILPKKPSVLSMNKGCPDVIHVRFLVMFMTIALKKWRVLLFGSTSNVVTPNAEKTNDGFQTVGKNKKRKGKSKSTNGGQFTGPPVKHNVRYEPKATTSAPMKGTTYVGYTSQSIPMLKTTGNSSKKDNLSMSNSFSALNEEEEDVENVYDESANLIQNTKAGGSSSFTAAAG
ncbi:zinc knuckle CX2CX4HX4C containing protein [Tanacetum coccineum]